jgi:hypothetical protein
MFYIIGRKSSNEIVEKSQIFTPVDMASYMAALRKNYGEECSIFALEDNDDQVKRIKNGDEFAAVWDDDEIFGLDFSIEDNKKILKFESDKTSFVADGIDSVNISVSVLTPAEKLDKTFNDVLDIPVSIGKITAKIRFTFENGVANREIKTMNPGTLVCPLNYRNGFRMDNILTIDAVI